MIDFKSVMGLVFLFSHLILVLQNPKDQKGISGDLIYQSHEEARGKAKINECNWNYEVDWWGSGQNIYANYEIQFQAPPPSGFSPFDILVKWRIVNTLGQPMTNYKSGTHTLTLSLPVTSFIFTWDGYNDFSGLPAPNGNYLVQSSIEITHTNNGSCVGDKVSKGYTISIPQ